MRAACVGRTAAYHTTPWRSSASTFRPGTCHLLLLARHNILPVASTSTQRLVLQSSNLSRIKCTLSRRIVPVASASTERPFNIHREAFQHPPSCSTSNFWPRTSRLLSCSRWSSPAPQHLPPSTRRHGPAAAYHIAPSSTQWPPALGLARPTTWHPGPAPCSGAGIPSEMTPSELATAVASSTQWPPAPSGPA